MKRAQKKFERDRRKKNFHASETLRVAKARNCEQSSQFNYDKRQRVPIDIPIGSLHIISIYRHRYTYAYRYYIVMSLGRSIYIGLGPTYSYTVWHAVITTIHNNTYRQWPIRQWWSKNKELD